jgi:uncharacterized MAPEG superfamily protein
MTTPLFCVFLAYCTIWLPKALSSWEQSKLEGGYDNADPRVQRKQLAGKGARAQAAHENGFEAFGPFAASVFVAHLGGANAELATVLSIVFVVMRVIYPFVYVAGLSGVRSTVFTVGALATVALFLSPLAS